MNLKLNKFEVEEIWGWRNLKKINWKMKKFEVEENWSWKIWSWKTFEVEEIWSWKNMKMEKFEVEEIWSWRNLILKKINVERWYQNRNYFHRLVAWRDKALGQFHWSCNYAELEENSVRLFEKLIFHRKFLFLASRWKEVD